MAGRRALRAEIGKLERERADLARRLARLNPRAFRRADLLRTRQADLTRRVLALEIKFRELDAEEPAEPELAWFHR